MSAHEAVEGLRRVSRARLAAAPRRVPRRGRPLRRRSRPATNMGIFRRRRAERRGRRPRRRMRSAAPVLPRAVLPTPPSPWMKITSSPPPLCASSKIFLISSSRPQKISPGRLRRFGGLAYGEEEILRTLARFYARGRRAAFRGNCCRPRRPLKGAPSSR